MKKKIEIRSEHLKKRIINSSVSPLKKYYDFVIGKPNVFFLISFEIITVLFENIPGMAGLFLRKHTFPRLLKKVGSNVIFGKGITIRHPKKISIGSNVIIDDHCVLDAKGDHNQGITIGDNVFIARNTMITCKGGDVFIGNDSSIGSNSILQSETSLVLGRYVLIAGGCYIVAGGSHDFEDTRIPIIFQKSLSKGGVVLHDDVWLGANVTVLDGATIQKGSVIGAGSVVTGEIPGYSIAAGSPAKVLKTRNPGATHKADTAI